MGKQNACYYLRSLYHQLDQETELHKLLSSLKVDYAKVQTLISERGDFWELYQEEVSRLLHQWWGDENFFDSISFDSAGRVVIDGDLIFKNHQACSPDYWPAVIRRVTGILDLKSTQIDSGFDYLEEVGSLILQPTSEVRSLQSLKRVEQNLSIYGSKVTTLPELEYIGGELIITEMDCFKSAPKLVEVGSIKGRLSGIEDLSSLAVANGNIDLSLTPIQELASLAMVDGNLNLENTTSLQTINSLHTVEGEMNISGSTVREIDGLVNVNGELRAKWAQHLCSMENLRSVNGDLFLEGTKIKSLPNLLVVGGGVYAKNEILLKELPLLESVGYNLSIYGTRISQLPNLKYVLGNMSIQGLASNGFRSLFPELKQIGLPTSSVEVCVLKQAIEDEIDRLVDNQELEFNGYVFITDE